MFSRSIRLAFNSSSAFRGAVAPKTFSASPFRFYSNTYYTKSHEWIRVDGDEGTVGITDFAQRQLGDIVFVELPEVGKTVSAGREASVIESVKAASEVYSPVSGKITSVNQEVAESPEMVNEDPMGDGYLYKIHLTDKSELKNLLDKDPEDN
ncbi:glycine cleavage system H-protein [Heterostelium album PN500]|uniref:Glycine cleavage system H protein n=1 Tax=Heterostelium pallidum (strain ATCC 26659 / Pp 5 / PN500) TaxID=670386 RepID=D3B1V3_HETP5|nr:glycine cleavage system H-protein [Heterostelium album PN500]EFA85277.1 glycine cleavage system H-protein [Heterostelium album PN500]|eukprot:XP_020437386.1 glycine cleavage system H-protein [Heterostelium album PN500]